MTNKLEISTMPSHPCTSAVLLIPLTALGCGQATRPTHSLAAVTAAAPSSCKSTNYPIVLTSHSPYVDLEIRRATTARRGFFLLDTGANTSAVDRSWSQGLVIPKEGDVVSVEKFSFVYEQPDVTFHSQDLTSFAQIQGKPQVGTLGTDYMVEFVADFDFARSVVRFVRDVDLPSCQQEWADLRHIALSNYTMPPPKDGPPSIPTINLTISSQSIPCQLDTGTAAVTDETWVALNQAAFRLLSPELELVRKDTLTHTGGPIQVDVYRRKDGKPISIQAGSELLSVDVILVEGPGAGKPFDSTTPYALAGMPLMRRWSRLVFDPFAKQLSYRP